MIRKVMDWVKPMIFEKYINRTSFNGKTILEVNEELAFQHEFSKKFHVRCRLSI